MQNQVIHIRGGILSRKGKDVLYIATDGSQALFEKVRLAVGWWIIPKYSAFQFCGCIFISRHWIASDFGIYQFAHEYGHLLQQREMGFWRYIQRVAVPSVLSLLRNPYDHHSVPCEEDATRRGLRYYHEQTSAK